MSQTKQGCCETTQDDCCPVEKSIQGACCPVDKVTELWTSSFFTALKESHVDILKEKIKANWGTKMEKEADAVIAAMATHWQSMQTQAKAQHDLKESMKQSLFDCRK